MEPREPFQMEFQMEFGESGGPKTETISQLFEIEKDRYPLYFNPKDGTVSNASVSNPQSAYYLVSLFG